MKRKDLIGQKFGRLTVLEFSHISLDKRVVWKCLCNCHNVCYVNTHSLTTKTTQSCGCLRKERASNSHKNIQIRHKMAISRRIPKNGNSLGEKFPEIASEWHPVKNGNKTPLDINHSSNDKAWWLGTCGHIWEMVIQNRTYQKQNCPICQESKGEREIRKILDKYNILYERQKTYINLHGQNHGLLRFDFYLPKYNILIEYNGQQHYGNNHTGYFKKSSPTTQLHDKIKRKYCKSNNIQLIEIKYTKFNQIENIINQQILLY